MVTNLYQIIQWLFNQLASVINLADALIHKTMTKKQKDLFDYIDKYIESSEKEYNSLNRLAESYRIEISVCKRLGYEEQQRIIEQDINHYRAEASTHFTHKTVLENIKKSIETDFC